MSNISLRRPALNIPLLALWAASICVSVLGATLLQRGNAELADFYASGGSDYTEFLGLQSQGTIGGMLLAAGVVGVFIALATHARNRAATVIAATSPAAADREDEGMDDVLYIEDFDPVDHPDEPADSATQRDASVAASTSDATADGAADPEPTRLEPASARG